MSNGLPSSLTHCSPLSQDSAGPCLFSVSTSLLFYSTLHKALFLLLLSHSPALSAQSLVFSVDHNREKVLPLLSLHWLFRWSSHPALLCSQSLKVKEIKHKYRVLACKLPDAKVRPSHFCTLSILSHSLFFSPPSASAWKINVVCNDVLPTFCFSSFSASSSHSPASRLNRLLSVYLSKATKVDRFHNLYSTPVTWITRLSSFPRPFHCSSPALPLSPCFSLSLCSSHPGLLPAVLLTR